jgi:hypothetical protein
MAAVTAVAVLAGRFVIATVDFVYEFACYQFPPLLLLRHPLVGVGLKAYTDDCLLLRSRSYCSTGLLKVSILLIHFPPRVPDTVLLIQCLPQFLISFVAGSASCRSACRPGLFSTTPPGGQYRGTSLIRKLHAPGWSNMGVVHP